MSRTAGDERKVIYYKDELHDEFSTAQITPRRIDGSYRYENNSLFKKLTHFFWYRVVATPLAFLYVQLKFGHRTVNRKVLAPYRKTGYFLFGNHTQDIGDAFIPTLLNFPQTDDVLVHPNNVSMPVLGKITPSLGALPLPDDVAGFRNLLAALEQRLKKGHTVVIYPEAHIWPYYTKIRPFTQASFRYPVKFNAPVFCFVNTYQKRRLFKKPRMVTYIDGPFFPDEALPVKERQRKLHEQVYGAMCLRAQKSQVEWIRYIKSNKEN